MEAFFPISTVARVMNTSVEAVEMELSKGAFHSVTMDGVRQLPAGDMCRMGAMLHLSHAGEMSQTDLDHVLDKFISPWAPLSH